jgi:hypothetical protein
MSKVKVLVIVLGLLLVSIPGIFAQEEPTGEDGAVEQAIFRSGFIADTDGNLTPIEAQPIFGVPYSPDLPMDLGIQPRQQVGNYVGVTVDYFNAYNVEGWSESYLSAYSSYSVWECSNVTSHEVNGNNAGGASQLCKSVTNAGDKATTGPVNHGTGCALYNFSGTANWASTQSYHYFDSTAPGAEGDPASFNSSYYKRYSCLGS